MKMNDKTESINTTKYNNKQTLQWSVYPVRENWRISILVIVLLLFVWISIYFLFNEIIWVILAIILLGGSLLPFFTVTRYHLDEHEVRVYRFLTSTRKQWSAFRSYYPDKQGVLLSPFTKPSRLENFRGVFLRFGNNRQEVLRFIEQKIGRIS